MALQGSLIQAQFDPTGVQVPSGPVLDLVPITPNDNNTVVAHRCIYIAVGGDLSFVTLGGTTRTVTLAAGWHPMVVARIRSTGTTATGISVGL